MVMVFRCTTMPDDVTVANWKTQQLGEKESKNQTGDYTGTEDRSELEQNTRKGVDVDWRGGGKRVCSIE